MNRPDPYQVHLTNFEGPLDLLLHLIKREELSIYDIPIARITEQYLAIIADLAGVDIDRAGEFLVMAATLLGIKSRMLLPKPKPLPDEEIPELLEDPREELVRQLESYSLMQDAVMALRDMESAQGQRFYRAMFPEAPVGPAPLAPLEVNLLAKAMAKILKAAVEWREVPREEIPLATKLTDIHQLLKEQPGGVRFSDCINRTGSRLEVVVTFLALLELLRRRRVIVEQGGLFDEIWVRPGRPEEALADDSPSDSATHDEEEERP